MVHKAGFYEKYVKRLLDVLISGLTLLILSPLMTVLTIVGTVVMKGNPFFVQSRPGKNEKIFKLIKFRTMTDSRDGSGNLLPDGQRLNGYGRFLRSTSLDELPELINIFIGQMSVVGPRPLL
ncbi:MAG: sugar transferase, partial [Clostridia bacterium]|nr:sugar transferase [Clostridia bacterium]